MLKREILFFSAVALKTKSFSYLFVAFNVIAFRNQRPIHSNLCGNPTKLKEKSQRVNHINRLKKNILLSVMNLHNELQL